MTIDQVDVVGSPGYWLDRCAKKLAGRQKRLQGLDDRLRGDPPLPEGSENVREAYKRFQAKARTNFAELIVEAPRERMTPGGIRIGAADPNDPSANRDSEAKRIWDANGLDVEFADVFESMLGLSDGYMIVGSVDEAIGAPVITGEDPRQVVTIHDPVQQRKVLAGLKMFHDPDQGKDFAFLYLPGDAENPSATVRKASIKNEGPGHKITFSPTTWSWDGEPEELNHGLVPVVRFRNRRGVGEFEQHIDVLDRINHTILMRLVITAMEAFRQRALQKKEGGDLPTHDDDGQEIDYDTLFAADPGALWDLPAGIEIWESEVTDIRPILEAVKSDIRDLAAVTRTPLSYLTPDAASQSAEGASLMREGLVFKVEDRIKRATPAIIDVFHLAFLTEGDDDRAVRSKMDVLWVPPERHSLAEKADAASKATDMPWRWRMMHIWGFTPEQVNQMEVDRAADALLAPPAAPTVTVAAPAVPVA